MELSKKTDYALRMVAELVRNEGQVVSVRVVAEQEGIPYSFARSIQRDLVRGGIIENSRGSRGGMRLVVDPRTTTVRTLVEVLQGPIKLSVCDRAGESGGVCPFVSECNFNPVWNEAEGILLSYFDSMTLYDVVVDHRHSVLTEGNHFELVDSGERSATVASPALAGE